MDTGLTGGVEQMHIQDQRIAELKRAERAARAKVSSAQQIDKVAEEFEAVFLAQMMQHMFAGVDMSGNPFGEEKASDDIYKSMLVDEYAKIISRSGGIGVADHVKREMLKLQEVEHADPTRIPSGRQ